MRQFQINEEDLAELERLVPELMDCIMEAFNDNGTRVRARKVKGILSDVRWNYGPPQEVHIEKVGEDDE